MPTTLRTELDRLGFDWEGGELVTQDGSGWQVPKLARKLKRTDPLLNQTFPNGPQLHLPRFWAGDKHYTYTVQVTQSSSGLQKTAKNANAYVAHGETIPYPDVS